jgi:hypothetical protein
MLHSDMKMIAVLSVPIQGLGRMRSIEADSPGAPDGGMPGKRPRPLLVLHDGPPSTLQSRQPRTD